MSNPHSDDVELARAAARGDPAAFAEIFDFYAPRVLKLARSMRSSEAEARALAEAILEAVFDNLRGFSGRVSLAAWVLAVARLVSRHAVGASPRATGSAAA